ncbi:hypothetical protein HGO53_01065 [Wolbachia endosymbiont of Diaphorina citri]|uniref:Uncharacterized protein n=1 Tax=Wolbachia endosymbiont of Ephestia elutella TaxID=3231696 RepID=A0AAU8MJ64_9RICK|nr:hypothetical protein [Wolbachia endosymbiont of Diaphorina citri]QJT96563.1 hypothetical protein HGO53_01065 [Wolbachia endosymbiont of Diaphorina citri]QLK11732.1 hypothetical protein FK497_05905 [Wolbachia endosymbiont of Diaphorina citri]QXY86642.1 hypothetical protein GZ064_01110 [Wolbachia endosymbiont of Diaphorina citri]QXY87852.1 hypothetical protein GZ065_01105 [Wolbachia endosymbiont of Diaphorina citri]QXY89912.1 hypothetical protein GZ066_06710 [Wolbachia endosymbiont of Diaphor
MGYENVQKVLLTSIKEDDPHKGLKELEIKRWCIAYQTLLNKWDSTIIPPLFKKVLEDETCWKIEDASGQIRLNRYTFGEKLLALKTLDGQRSLIRPFDRYRIACWCCFEDEIRAIFEEFKLTLGSKPVESLVKGCDKGALMIYWSHAMNNQEHQLELNNEHPYVYAFKCAMLEKHVEALEFFWDKLQSIDSVSPKRKEDLLMEAAYNKGRFSTDDVGMVDFCLRHLDPNRYHELLKRDFKQHGCYYTLSILRRNHSFESARKLFEHLKPEDLSPEAYSTSMFSALNSLVSAPDDNFIKSGSDMLTSMWNRPGFEAHRQHFLHELSGQYSPSRYRVGCLIERNVAIEILSEIINSLSQEQMQYIMDKDKSRHEVFAKVRNKQLVGGGDQLPSSSLDVETIQQKVTDVRRKV